MCFCEIIELKTYYAENTGTRQAVSLHAAREGVVWQRHNKLWTGKPGTHSSAHTVEKAPFTFQHSLQALCLAHGAHHGAFSGGVEDGGTAKVVSWAPRPCWHLASVGLQLQPLSQPWDSTPNHSVGRWLWDDLALGMSHMRCTSQQNQCVTNAEAFKIRYIKILKIIGACHLVSFCLFLFSGLLLTANSHLYNDLQYKILKMNAINFIFIW